MSANSVVLRNHMDWDNWIREIRVKAIEHGVWQYVNPERENPPQLVPLEQPDYQTILSSGSSDSLKRIHYEIVAKEWSEQRESYKAKKAAISSLLSAISQSLASEHRYILDDIDDEEIDTRSILIKLQDKLKPSKWESDSKVRSEWRSLQRGWNRRISLDDWLNQWSVIYRQAKKLGLYDFPEERVFSDFLLTIEPIDPQFPSQIDTERRLGQKESFESIVNRFREKRRRQSEHPAHRKQWEAFPSFRGQDEASGHQEAKPRAERTPWCVCGRPGHMISSCWIINEDQRPSGWRPSMKLLEKVEQAIKQDSNLQ